MAGEIQTSASRPLNQLQVKTVREQELVRQAKLGDKKALAALLQEHYRMVLGYFIRLTLDKSQAEDLAQETMVRAIEKFGLFDEHFKFATWLVAVGTNIYRDQLRRKDAKTQPVDEEALDAAERNEFQWEGRDR